MQSRVIVETRNEDSIVPRTFEDIVRGTWITNGNSFWGSTARRTVSCLLDAFKRAARG